VTGTIKVIDFQLSPLRIRSGAVHYISVPG